MVVFEIFYPGTWIDLADKDAARLVERYLSCLQTSFNQAAMAMYLFDQAQERRVKEIESHTDGVAESYEESPGDFAQLVRETADDGEAFVREWCRRALETRRERWRNGEIPRAYRDELEFIYARSFLFSVSTIGKLLERISECQELPPEVVAATRDFNLAFPLLGGLRDSSAHVDERVVGKARRHQIEPRPLEGEFGLCGEFMVIENLAGRRFFGTTAAGALAEIEVGVDTMTQIRQCFQRVLDCLPWRGPSWLCPE